MVGQIRQYAGRQDEVYYEMNDFQRVVFTLANGHRIEVFQGRDGKVEIRAVDGQIAIVQNVTNSVYIESRDH